MMPVRPADGNRRFRGAAKAVAARRPLNRASPPFAVLSIFVTLQRNHKILFVTDKENAESGELFEANAVRETDIGNPKATETAPWISSRRSRLSMPR
jgi:hypothetical protein